MATTAGIVVTGTEVLTGRISDRNGPWLAERLRVLGVDVGQLLVVGDRAADLDAALRYLAGSGVALIITTGGLGPTADDLTAEVVASVQGRPAQLDPALQQQIGAIVQRLIADRGWRTDPAATQAGIDKQALVPVGADALPPTGTAPGLVVPVADSRTGPPVLVLPGPPGELQAMWPAALANRTVQAALAGRSELRQRTIRLWGTPESELAAMLRQNSEVLAGLEVSTCLRSGELEIVTRYQPDAEDNYQQLRAAVLNTFGDTVFSPDGQSVDELVAELLLDRQLSIATAESCTAGMLAARIADRAGSSAYLLGGVVSYANQAKDDLLAVPAELIESVGAVSAEVAEAMADGARARLGADLGVGITGVAGPGGGTADKPVGLVHLCVSGAGPTTGHRVQLGGSRADIRLRATVIALHLIRQQLTRSSLG